MIQPVYFFYFMSVGISMPFFAPHLRSIGLSGTQIGAVLSIVPVLNMGVPLFWAWTADRSRRHARILSGICLGACCGYLPLLFARSFWPVAFSYLAYALFGVGIGTLVDSIAIARARAGADYGRMRVWGSVGYITSAVGIGAILTSQGGRPLDRLVTLLPFPLPVVPLAVAAALFATFVASLQLQGTGESPLRPHWSDVRTLMRNPRFRFLLVVAPLHWIGCAPYNVFFGLFVADRHMTPLVVGAALALGAAAEMVILVLFTRLRRRFDIETLLVVAFAGTAVRWMLMPLVTSTATMVTLQLFHALTFGLFWGAGIALVTDCVPPTLRATGQSLYVTSMLGVGNVVGYLTTGWIYDGVGRIDPAFLAAAALELLPLGLAIWARQRRLFDSSRGTVAATGAAPDTPQA